MARARMKRHVTLSFIVPVGDYARLEKIVADLQIGKHEWLIGVIAEKYNAMMDRKRKEKPKKKAEPVDWEKRTKEAQKEGEALKKKLTALEAEEWALRGEHQRLLKRLKGNK
jgi:hypothetical protein